MKSKYFWLIIIVTSLAASALIQWGLDSFNMWNMVIRATGIIVFPAIATLIIAGATKLIEKELSKLMFYQIFSICWMLSLLFLLVPFVGSYLN